MKSLLLVTLLALSFGAKASEPVKIKTYKSAFFRLCPRDTQGRSVLLGCRDSIQLNKNEKAFYEVDKSLNWEARQCLDRALSIYMASGILRSPPFKVSGYTVLEKGRFPNPMGTFKVFYITDGDTCSLPIPSN